MTMVNAASEGVLSAHETELGCEAIEGAMAGHVAYHTVEIAR